VADRKLWWRTSHTPHRRGCYGQLAARQGDRPGAIRQFNARSRRMSGTPLFCFSGIAGGEVGPTRRAAYESACNSGMVRRKHENRSKPIWRSCVAWCEVKLRRMVLGSTESGKASGETSLTLKSMDNPVGLRTLQLVPADDALLVAEFDSLTQVPEAVLNALSE